MIHKYKNVSIIYGGKGREYADRLNNRICDIAEKERYPISTSIIMERVLTAELLNEVMDLFKKSDYCVTFLTLDDVCLIDGHKKYRLRQNVVFELGMALIYMGRNHCILLSDFDVKSTDIDLPSDMGSLDILQFSPETFDDTITNVINKILKFSQESPSNGKRSRDIPQYNSLLTREDYYIDYENLFTESNVFSSAVGATFLKETLSSWCSECENLSHFDEQCIFILERIGFIPLFGKLKEVDSFLLRSTDLVQQYSYSDVKYYSGNTGLLNFTSDLISGIIDYTRLKEIDNPSESNGYSELLERLLSVSIPDQQTINPLLLVVYYDYLGLTYLRLARLSSNTLYYDLALESFLKSKKNVSKVDMSMQIWTGFLDFNIARVYKAKSDTAKATDYYKSAIQIRQKWLHTSKYNVTIRHAMSFEFFIAKIDYIDMCKQFSLFNEDIIRKKYSDVETELNAYSEKDDEFDRLVYIRRLLNERK